MVCRIIELWNVELNKEERKSLWRVSRCGSSLEIYNSAAISKKRVNNHFDKSKLE